MAQDNPMTEAEIRALVLSTIAAAVKKISALPATTSVEYADLLPTVSTATSATKKATFAQMLDRSVGTFLNAQQLRELDTSVIEDNSLFFIKGIEEPGDGGHGFYYYDSASVAAEDGGAVLEPATSDGRFLRLFSGVVSVKSFGAVGDGTTDDTAAINAATAYVNSIGGGAVFFPFSSVGYLTDGIKYYDNMTFIPECKGTMIKKKAGAVAGDIFDAADNGANAISNVQWLPGFLLDGNKANQSAQTGRCGINLQGAVNVLIDGIEIKNCALDCILLYGSGPTRTIPCDNVVIRDSLLTGGQRTNMAIITAQNVVIENTMFLEGGDAGSASSCNLDIEPDTSTDTLKNITFRRCIFQEAVFRGVVLTPVGSNRNDANITFDQCGFIDNGTFACVSLNNAFTLGPINFVSCYSHGNGSGFDLNRIYHGSMRGCNILETSGFGLNISNNNVSFSITDTVLQGGTSSQTEYDFAINDTSNTGTFVGSDVQFVNNRFLLGGTGSIWDPRQMVFKVTKVANGVKGCASANGCYVINDGITLVSNISAANPQLVAMAGLPANAFIYKGSQYSVTPITGVSTATMTIGNLTSPTAYSASSYDLMAAASNTNFLDFTTAAGRSTKASDFVRMNITYTGGDGTNVDVGAEWIVTLFWGTENR